MRVVCEVVGVIYFPICATLQAKKRQSMRESRRLEAKREKHQIDSDALDKLLNYYSTRTYQRGWKCIL